MIPCHNVNLIFPKPISVILRIKAQEVYQYFDFFEGRLLHIRKRFQKRGCENKALKHTEKVRKTTVPSMYTVNNINI